jgi:hypothetical protein
MARSSVQIAIEDVAEADSLVISFIEQLSAASLAPVGSPAGPRQMSDYRSDRQKDWNSEALPKNVQRRRIEDQTSNSLSSRHRQWFSAGGARATREYAPCSWAAANGCAALRTVPPSRNSCASPGPGAYVSRARWGRHRQCAGS